MAFLPLPTPGLRQTQSSPRLLQVHDTPRVLEEKSPQYRFKMDFVNVSATSTLTLEVLEPPSMLASAIRKLPLLHKVGQSAHGSTCLARAVIFVWRREPA